MVSNDNNNSDENDNNSNTSRRRSSGAPQSTGFKSRIALKYTSYRSSVRRWVDNKFSRKNSNEEPDEILGKYLLFGFSV